jgi:cytoskeletal protein CcmA (bactofilin family)
MIAALIALVIMLGFGMTLLMVAIGQLRDADRKKKESRALCLAEGGVEHALWRLYQGTLDVPATVVISDLGGTATTTVRQFTDAAGQPVPDCVIIQSAGETQGWTTAVRVGARYLSTTTQHSPIYDYALFSDSDLRLGGGTVFDHHIHSNGSLRLNGGVTLDGTLEAAGNVRLIGSNVVTGDVRYGGTYNTTGGTTIGGDVLEGTDVLPMPTIDLAYYRSQAVEVYTDDHTFAGTTDFPDGIVYVEGDVHLSGQVSGTGTLVVNGNVTITGSVTYGEEGSELAIVSTGQVSISGGSEVHGIIYAHNVQSTAGWVGTGNVTVYGAVIADTIDSNGALVLHYEQPGQVSLPGDSSQPTQIAVFSWEKIT